MAKSKLKKKPAKRSVKKYVLTMEMLKELDACGDGIRAFRQELARRKRKTRLTITAAEALSHPDWGNWLAENLKLTGMVTKTNNFLRNGRYVGFRAEDGSGYFRVATGPAPKECYCGNPGCTYGLAEPYVEVRFDRDMPRSYRAVVRAARQRLRAQGAGGVWGVPTAS
jgi:hypothetical protein